MSNRDGKNLFGIGAVSKITGLSDHTIRVWERRYSAVVAQRAENGRRVYTPEDVEKLGLLKKLTDEGLAIGHIADNDLEELRERLRDIDVLVAAPVPRQIDAAILGEFLPTQFGAHGDEIAPVRVPVASQNRDQFVADIKRQHIDVVILESPVLDTEVSSQLLAYMDEAGAARGVIVYSFGRDRDIESVRSSRIVALRAPVSVDELRAAIIRAYTPPPAPRAEPASDSTGTDWTFSGPVPPRRFSSGQLASLARASTAIDCECPHHLAQLVADLTAFEVYSAQCENRGDEDAALHHYLHQVTAQARALIEEALERVARAEGIDY